MATVVLTAAKGRPGVSTWATALAFAWPAGTGREVVLVDADVSGGGPLSAFQRYGLGDGRGLLRWSTARNGGSDLVNELHSLDAEGSRRLLAGLPDPVAGAAVAPRWSALVVALRELTDGGQRDVLVDLGRLGSRHEAEPLLAAADLVTFS
ncbi:MAG TPA: hypothetical protein VFN19_10150, partial [Candidatus Nanopelagicales bacterium]|nr:hypothetical protein [Candidatus Nanopelagicales bacterium]